MTGELVEKYWNEILFCSNTSLIKQILIEFANEVTKELQMPCNSCHLPLPQTLIDKNKELQEENKTLSQNLDDAMSVENALKKRNEKLEKRIEKMKSNVIYERDEAKRLEDVITYTILNNILVKWGIKEK